MKQNLDPLGYDNINLLSCMTLDVVFSIYARLWKHSKRSIKMHSCDFMVCLYHTSCGSWCQVPESINTTTSSDQSHERRNFKDAGLGKCAWVYATEKCAPGNHHGKGWNTSRLPYQKEVQVGEKVRFRSTSNATNRDMPHKDEPEKNTVEYMLKCPDSTPVVIKEVVRVNIL